MLKVKEVRMNYERHLMGIDEMPRFLGTRGWKQKYAAEGIQNTSV